MQSCNASGKRPDSGDRKHNGKDRETMTNLERILAKAFMGIVVSIDLTDEDDIDPDVATSLLEPVAALLQGMAEDDRRALTDLFAECAQDEQIRIGGWSRTISQPLWDCANLLGAGQHPGSNGY